uniref:hypothetical protein n=1 Tax=Alloprevotella sp. TaxID=1872471 RepID=UPI0040299DE3
MKHLVCIYILLFALAMLHLNSCQRANTRQELERVDSLLECVPMDTNAITELLDKVGAKPNELNHNDSMYYVMLKHDYLVKRFYRLNNDSMMRQAVRHYDKHGTAYDKMRAHYILACMLYDDMKFKESQKECFTATQCNDTTTLRSIKLLGKCYMLLGGISKKQPDNDIVRRSYEKAAYYAKETQDSCTLGDCYGHLVDHFRWENNYDMMYEYSRKAYDLYTKLGLKKDAYDELLPMSEVCLHRNELAKTNKFLLEYEKNVICSPDAKYRYNQSEFGVYYSNKGDYYLLKGMTDSAIICYHNELKYCSELVKASTYGELANAYSIKNQTDSVNKYLTKYIIAHSKADSLKNSGTLNHNFHVDENEKLRKENEALKNRTFTSFTWGAPLKWGFPFIVVCLTAYWCFKKRNTIYAQINLFFFSTYILIRSIFKKRDDALAHLTDGHKRFPSLENIKKELDNLARKEKPITDQNIWDGLLFYMQTYNRDFIVFLNSFSNQTDERDIHICMLTRLGYSPKALAALLSISKQNTTKLRANLSKVLFNEDGKSSKNFDNLIRNFQGKP